MKISKVSVILQYATCYNNDPVLCETYKYSENLIQKVLRREQNVKVKLNDEVTHVFINTCGQSVLLICLICLKSLYPKI